MTDDLRRQYPKLTAWLEAVLATSQDTPAVMLGSDLRNEARRFVGQPEQAPPRAVDLPSRRRR